MFLTDKQIKKIGFAEVGNNTQISEFAHFYNPSNIKIGSRVRIDDFTIISAGEGGIKVGNNVHIANGCTLIGAGEINLCDFVGISGGCRIYSSTDDYVGGFLIGPTVPNEYRNVITSRVHIGKHVVIGAGSILLPRPPEIVVGDGATFGVLSFLNKDYEEWKVYVGQPARFLKDRDKENVLRQEKEYLESLNRPSNKER